jgi:hypothetical protein
MGTRRGRAARTFASAARRIDRVIDALSGAEVTIDGVEITGGHGAPESAGDDGGG